MYIFYTVIASYPRWQAKLLNTILKILQHCYSSVIWAAMQINDYSTEAMYAAVNDKPLGYQLVIRINHATDGLDTEHYTHSGRLHIFSVCFSLLDLRGKDFLLFSFFERGFSAFPLNYLWHRILHYRASIAGFLGLDYEDQCHLCLRSLPESHTQFVSSAEFFSDMPRTAAMAFQFIPVSLNCSICTFAMLKAGLPPVLGNLEGTLLKVPGGDASTTSDSFLKPRFPRLEASLKVCLTDYYD